jgi:hypothetical protein
MHHRRTKIIYNMDDILSLNRKSPIYYNIFYVIGLKQIVRSILCQTRILIIKPL